MNEQINRVVTEFTKQAKHFNEYQQVFSKDEYNAFALEHMELQGDESVLEVAAGTCAFGRCVAPLVKHVTELDVTEAMLNVGRAEAQKRGLTNVSFVQAQAEQLPFEDASFDCVMSRLAFHHFANPQAVFAEMRRVLKPNGKLVVIDMQAREEALRQTADHWERLRDPSHVRCLSEEEFRQLATGMSITFCQTIQVPVRLAAWMDVTDVAEPIRKEITRAMELDGTTPTGFEPYREDGQLCFNHRWMLLVAQKTA